MMALQEQLKNIRTRQDFLCFLQHLRQDLHASPASWENSSLEAYFAAMAAWLHDMEGYDAQRGEPLPAQLTWKHLGEILLAARTYE